MSLCKRNSGKEMEKNLSSAFCEEGLKTETLFEDATYSCLVVVVYIYMRVCV